MSSDLSSKDLKEFKRLLKLKIEYRRLIELRFCRWLHMDCPQHYSLRRLARRFGVSKDTVSKWIKDDESYNKIMKLSIEHPTFMEDLQNQIWTSLIPALISLGKSPEECKQKEEERYRETLKQRILEGYEQ